MHVVRDFLRAKGLAMSAATWDELYARRIEPALAEGTLTVADLRGLLREVEECGRQHVFLFRCNPQRAAHAISPAQIQIAVAAMGLAALMNNPLDLELPDAPEIVDIRGIPAGDGMPTSLLIKQVETRTTNAFLRADYDEAREEMSRVYSVIKKRAVNVARLYEDGLLELRIASQDNSTRYQDNVKAFFAALKPLINGDDFVPISLAKAKARIWNEQDQLNGQIRFSQSEARNDFGYSMNVASSSQSDSLSSDDGSRAALQSFLDNDGKVTRTNIYFRIPDDEQNREVHVLLSGEINEFAIPASCAAEEYQYVRGKIQSFNS